jgi:hypothetical protein
VKTDRLLYDIVIELLLPLKAQGLADVDVHYRTLFAAYMVIQKATGIDKPSFKKCSSSRSPS